MENSFHGRTLATLAATGRAKYRQGFEPDMPGFKHVPFNDFDALAAAVTDKTCGIMLEIIQGEGGVLPVDKDYLKKVRALCDEKDIMLLCDEVQCGMGRTGALFGWQDAGVEPDAFSVAKALANGVPMGGFIVKRKFADVLTPGTHGSTFGGTPLASAAALAVQQVIEEENILENCRIQGEYMMARLKENTAGYSFVQTVRGRGLMIGIVLDHPAAALSGVLMEKGLVTLTAGETVLRLLPPLVITREEADAGLSIIEAGLAEYAKTLKDGE
jgi:acetylornithine/succinyldiaminopimelate/putrescine aminotransferase